MVNDMIVIKFVWDIIGLGALYMLLGMLLSNLGMESDSLKIYIEFGLYTVILLSLLMFIFRLRAVISELKDR